MLPTFPHDSDFVPSGLVLPLCGFVDCCSRSRELGRIVDGNRGMIGLYPKTSSRCYPCANWSRAPWWVLLVQIMYFRFVLSVQGTGMHFIEQLPIAVCCLQAMAMAMTMPVLFCKDFPWGGGVVDLVASCSRHLLPLLLDISSRDIACVWHGICEIVERCQDNNLMSHLVLVVDVCGLQYHVVYWYEIVRCCTKEVPTALPRGDGLMLAHLIVLTCLLLPCIWRDLGYYRSHDRPWCGTLVYCGGLLVATSTPLSNPLPLLFKLPEQSKLFWYENTVL
jgi:hypothetical protein